MKINFEIKRVDHLGIVAGIIQDLGLAELVNQQIGTDNQEILTTGDVVAGMVLNGLEFASRPLMLAPQFFENKALDLLIRPGVTSENFNRHRLGRALDAIANFGCEKLFNFVALSACKTEGVVTDFLSADTTSYELSGKYETEDVYEGGIIIEEKIKITYGYSKAKRPDLKQVIQELVTTHDGGIPLMTKTLSGNASDSVILRERASAIMSEFAKSETRCLVADCKLYAKETAGILNNINFLTRVPATLKLEQESVRKAITQEDKWTVLSDDYKYQEFPVSLYGIENQRWIIFYSKAARERSNKTLDKEIIKEKTAIEKELLRLHKSEFGCEADALKELQTLTKKWRYHNVVKVTRIDIKTFLDKGRPTEKSSYKITCQINAEIVFDQASADRILDQRSCFILATNLSQKSFSVEEVLKSYKRQDFTEKGFAFLKKPEFFTASLNLEKVGRIEAILMIMVLSLLVYSIAQRRLRRSLLEYKITIPNQLKKPTQKPTMRWIFQLFEGVDFVVVKLKKTYQASMQGLNDVRKKVIELLGKNVLRIYQTAWSKG